VQHSYRNNGGCSDAAASVQTTQGCSNLLHIQADSGVMIFEKKHQEQQSVWERKDLVLKIGSQSEKRVFRYQLIALFIYLIKHTLKYVRLIH